MRADIPMRRWHAGQRGFAPGAAGSQPDDAHLISAQSPLQLHMRDVYCYFDNDIKVRAPFDAKALIAKLERMKPQLTRSP